MKQHTEMQHLLKRKKLKKTSQRELIWSVLVETKGHPSAEQIRNLLIAKGHRIGVATVYRTLKLLLSSGLIRQSRLHGMTRYEPVFGEPNHLHFICNVCGSNVEFPSHEVETLIQQVTKEFGFEERYSRYAIFGVCKSCSIKESRAQGISPKRRLEKIMTRDALELTLAIERRGYGFYTSASRKTKDTSGRLMFHRLAAEESDHLKRLQEEYHSLIARNPWLKQEPARLAVSRRIADEIFPQKILAKIEMSDKTTDLEALNVAMDLEQRSRQFFLDFANQMTDAKGRKIFKHFADDEKSHLDSLVAEYNKLMK